MSTPRTTHPPYKGYEVLGMVIVRLITHDLVVVSTSHDALHAPLILPIRDMRCWDAVMRVLTHDLVVMNHHSPCPIAATRCHYVVLSMS